MSDLLGTLRESVKASLAANLAKLWSKQNPGKRYPSAMDRLSIEIDFRDVAEMADFIARNAAQAVEVMEPDDTTH